jgi:hypothetical protein
VSDQGGVPRPAKAEYAAEPYGAAYAGAPCGEAGPWRTNGAALAGAILSVLPPLGLALSIIGLVKAGRLGGAGKTAATVGIVLSVVFAGGYGFGAYELVKSVGVDPACSSVSATEGSLNADGSPLAVAASASGGGGRAALGALVSELQTLKSELDRDVTKATHVDVRAKIQAADGDLAQMIAGAKAVENGDGAAAAGLETAAARLQVDEDAVDVVCGFGDTDGGRGGIGSGG